LHFKFFPQPNTNVFCFVCNKNRLRMCFCFVLFAGLFCVSFQSFRLLRCDQQYLGAYLDQRQRDAAARSLCLEMCSAPENFQSHKVRQAPTFEPLSIVTLSIVTTKRSHLWFRTDLGTYLIP